MRQPTKPFSVETRHAGRRKPPAPPIVANNIFGPGFSASSTSETDRFRAADALFNDRRATSLAPSSRDDLFSPAAEHRKPVGRILQAIEVTPVEIKIDLPLEPPRRRGRPPGSKNKNARVNRDDIGERSDVVSADVLVASLFDEIDEPAPTLSVPPPVKSIQSGERVRSSWRKADLGPGERWKRRLSRFCW